MHQMDFISQEVNRMEATGRLIEEQVCILYNASCCMLYIGVIIVTLFIVFTVKRTGTC